MKYKIYFKVHYPWTYRAEEQRTIIEADTPQEATQKLYDMLDDNGETEIVEIVEMPNLL